jgi:predicted amidohydrolase
MKIGFLQFGPKFGQKKQNVEKVKSLLFEADADLMVLPELFNSGYAFDSMAEVQAAAEGIPDFTVKELLKVSEEKKMFIVAGLAEKQGKNIYNSSVLVSPDGKVSVYRKAHLFSDENKFFSKGNIPFEPFLVNGISVGLLICFDWIFPETIRSLALKGAQIICQPANLVLPYCQQVMIARAVENRVFVITANRIGQERKYTFTGRSQVVAPGGKVLIKAGEDEEKAGIVEVDPEEAKNKWVNEDNHIFKGRRPELYAKALIKD